MTMASTDLSNVPSHIQPARPWTIETVRTLDHAIRSPSHSAVSGVALGRFGFSVAWCGIYLFHIVCGAYFVTAGKLYWILPDTLLARYLSLYELTVNPAYFYEVAVVHYIIAALHFFFVFKSPLQRVESILLAWGSKTRHGPPDSLRLAAPRDLRSSLRGGYYALHHGVRSHIVSVYAALFSSKGLFGVQGRYFEIVFLVRELIETVLQSYQAYQMSRLLPRVILNRFYVAVLVINCWITLLLHHILHDRSIQRLLCLLSDIVLDFVASIGVPVAMALSYRDTFDFSIGNFPYQCWYNDLWLINFMNESPIMLFGSWVEAFSRLFFSVSLLTSVRSIKNLIKRRRVVHPHAGGPKLPPHVTLDSHHSVQPRTDEMLPHKMSRLLRCAHYAIALYGAFILALHVYAEFKPVPMGCVMEVRPWLVRQRACAMIELSCNPHAVRPHPSTGNATEIEAALGDVDPGTFALLVIRHCPQVEFTPHIRRFPNLLSVKTYNCTIRSWPENAAYDAAHHPSLRFSFFIRTNFPNKTLPPGLLSPHVPPTLLDIEIAVSNLQHLPSDLHTKWPHGLFLILEQCEFTTFPETLLHLDITEFSFGGNPLTDVDASVLTMPFLYWLSLRGTGLSSLPDSGINASAIAFGQLFVDYTNLSSLPSWMDESFLQSHSISAGATPLCRSILDAQALPELASSLLTDDPRLAFVDCEVRSTKAFPSFPIYFEERPNEAW
ncbi:hypothetical protein PINS_up023396 [Pythium insidiosum]|nr:hypothetical protein PINS_up023396 [Pythium insidiosum]